MPTNQPLSAASQASENPISTLLSPGILAPGDPALMTEEQKKEWMKAQAKLKPSPLAAPASTLMQQNVPAGNPLSTLKY